MPPQSGPSLTVQANPVNTYVAAAAPAVALYDQQQVAMAQQLVSAFSDLSVTAARFAGSMKAEQNEEDIKAGMDLVNKSRKSYQKLVESGEISPLENPWMAVGAQQASGAIEGMKARVEFEQIYEMKKAQDPKFLDNADAFDALAAQYAQNANTNLGDASYQTRAFYEAFNPYIASKAMEHGEAIVKHRQEKIITGLGADVFRAVEDYSSVDPIVRNSAVAALQERMDTVTGISQQQMNNSVVDFLVDQMKESDNPEQAEEIFASLKAGTGLLKDTEYAQMRLGMNRADIERNKDRMSKGESLRFDQWLKDSTAQAVKEGWSDERINSTINGALYGPEAIIRVSAQEIESKKAWGLRQFEEAKKEHQRMLLEKRKNSVIESIDTLTNDPSKDYDTGLSLLQAKMDALDVPTEERWQWKSQFDALYKDRAEYREDLILRQQEDILWYGSDDTSGLSQNLRMQVDGFFKTGNLPKFGDFKTSYDDWLISRGVSPETDKAKAAYKQAYSRMEAMIDSQFDAAAAQFGGDLRPQANDTPDVQSKKADIRGRQLMLKMHLGSVFDDRRIVSQTVNNFVRVLNPAAVEAGNQALWPVEDMITSYSYMVQNNLDPETILPGGENGKALKETLSIAANRLRSGENMYEIARDVASQRFFGETMKVTELAFRTNNLGWANLTTGNNEDLLDYNENLARLTAGRVDNPDSSFFATYQFQKYYLDALGQTRDHGTAIDTAKSMFYRNNMSVRGSLIPRNSGFVDEYQAEAWLDLNYPNTPTATLVVVSLEPTGQPIFAVRDEDGNAVRPSREGADTTPRLYRPSDLFTTQDQKEINKKAAIKAQEDRARRKPWWMGQ